VRGTATSNAHKKKGGKMEESWPPESGFTVFAKKYVAAEKRTKKERGNAEKAWHSGLGEA